MSMSGESRPISRSRTQPPTINARPPASRTARAIAVARSRGVVMIENARNAENAEFADDYFLCGRCDLCGRFYWKGLGPKRFESGFKQHQELEGPLRDR